MFEVESLAAPAAFPRHFGATLAVTDQLQLAYLKYTNARAAPDGAVVFNLIFVHGNGMNKSVWKYYIRRLAEWSDTLGAQQGWHIQTMVTFDAAVHGDLALLNANKLGWLYRWEDGGRDLNALVRHEQARGAFVQSPRARNIVVGHSLGGTELLFALHYEPALYDLVFTIDPVGYATTASRKHFTKLIPLLNKLYQDEFDSERLCELYLRHGFMKNFDARVLEDLIADEMYVARGRFRTKASKYQQLAIYMGGFVLIPKVMELLPLLTTPVVHIGVSRGKFNPPGTAEFIRNAVPAPLVTAIDLDGEHLVNAEQPDAVLECLARSLAERAALARANAEFYPEVRFEGDRKRIFAEKSALMLAGGYQEEEKPKL